MLGAESLSVQDLAQFAPIKEAKELHHFHNTYKKNSMKDCLEKYKEFNRSISQN